MSDSKPRPVNYEGPLGDTLQFAPAPDGDGLMVYADGDDEVAVIPLPLAAAERLAADLAALVKAVRAKQEAGA